MKIISGFLDYNKGRERTSLIDHFNLNLTCCQHTVSKHNLRYVPSAERENSSTFARETNETNQEATKEPHEAKKPCCSNENFIPEAEPLCSSTLIFEQKTIRAPIAEFAEALAREECFEVWEALGFIDAQCTSTLFDFDVVKTTKLCVHPNFQQFLTGNPKNEKLHRMVYK